MTFSNKLVFRYMTGGNFIFFETKEEDQEDLNQFLFILLNMTQDNDGSHCHHYLSVFSRKHD